MVIPEESVAPILDEPEMSLSSAKDDMIVHVPVIFKADMMKVWGLISVIPRDIDCWTYVKSAQWKIYGRNSYHNLWDNLLGPENVDNMERKSKRLLVPTH